MRLTLLMVLASLAAFSSASANVLDNADFTQASDGVLRAWTLPGGKPISITKESPEASGGSVAIVTDPSAAGGTCAQMHSNGQASGQYTELISDPIHLVAGFSYSASFKYRASGLFPDNADRTKVAAVSLAVNFRNPPKNSKSLWLHTYDNTDHWSPMSGSFKVPDGVTAATVNLALNDRCENNPASAAWCDIQILPDDPTLPNGDFEVVGAEGVPSDWKKVGTATVGLSADGHNGSKAVTVSDAPQGDFSGWATEIPVRPDRSYSFTGYARGAGISPNGPIPGGTLELQFLDRDGQPLGRPVLSESVSENGDWKQLKTAPAAAPAGAMTAELIAGMQFCRGISSFSNMSLEVTQSEASGTQHLKRPNPHPSSGVHYAANLLANGDVEQGSGDSPANWTFVGKSAPDWTPGELEELYTNSRPNYSIGRARGVWTSTAYAGEHALELIPNNPPESDRQQWYGGNPVAGCWMSAPMACEPGKAYIAAAWIKCGRRFSAPWYGPLELQFFDAGGKQLNPAKTVRSPFETTVPGEWFYWSTAPWITPQNAVSMRLRFGQELQAASGDFGTVIADDLAVWQLPNDAPPAKPEQIQANSPGYYAWFAQATATLKAPYLPSPADAPAYTNTQVQFENTQPGNIFADPHAPLPMRAQLHNQLGEDRQVRLHITRYDAQGDQEQPIESEPVTLQGGSSAELNITLPPTNRFGAFYLATDVLENGVTVGSCGGRVAVIPPRTRPHTQPPLWAVTTLAHITGDHSPYEQEVMQLLKRAGFDYAWERLYYSRSRLAELDPAIHQLLKITSAYNEVGIKSIITLALDSDLRPVDPAVYKQVGQTIGTALRGQVAAIGNWGIEQANTKSPFRGAGANRYTDKEYDTILAAQYDGIKSVAPEMTVLTGNIATDMEGITLQRLYGPPGNGKFDGTVMNAYAGASVVLRNALKQFDAHGDAQKAVWSEEAADQRSAYEGPARRYTEIHGAENMVKTWLTLHAQGGARLKSLTMWGFCVAPSDGNSDTLMVSPNLQPRPQYAACAVMTDQLADAELAGTHNRDNVSIVEFKRSDSTLLVGWTDAGEDSMTVKAPAGDVTLTDLYGNQSVIPTRNGIASIKLSASPVYISGPIGMAVFDRLQARMIQAPGPAGTPLVALDLQNKDVQEITGTALFPESQNPAAVQKFDLAPGASTRLIFKVDPAQVQSEQRTQLHAKLSLSDGSEVDAAAALNFAQAACIVTPPPMDGTWKGWESAPVIAFTQPPPAVIGFPMDEPYRGPDDIRGELRLMWDRQNLYLGVQALDDKHVAQPDRDKQMGFMADSIEFGIQPQAKLQDGEPYWEYEMYLPADGKPGGVINRRTPFPAGPETRWPFAVKLTGRRGDCIYQVAIPWKDLGVDDPAAGKRIGVAIVLNDVDDPAHKRTGGGRKRIRWFAGIDSGKSPREFGVVTLMQAP